MTCDAQGLIGREMFAIDGVKLTSAVSHQQYLKVVLFAHEAEASADN